MQSVTPDSLNRLVACTADDAHIIAICGETKLDNPEGSWWTMIQVRHNLLMSCLRTHALSGV